METPTLIRLTSLAGQPSMMDPIWTFDGVADQDDSRQCYVYADHGMAKDLAAAIQQGEDVLVRPEPWAVRWRL